MHNRFLNIHKLRNIVFLLFFLMLCVGGYWSYAYFKAPTYSVKITFTSGVEKNAPAEIKKTILLENIALLLSDDIIIPSITPHVDTYFLADLRTYKKNYLRISCNDDIIKLKVTAPSYEQAEAIAKAIADNFSREIINYRQRKEIEYKKITLCLNQTIDNLRTLLESEKKADEKNSYAPEQRMFFLEDRAQLIGYFIESYVKFLELQSLINFINSLPPSIENYLSIKAIADNEELRYLSQTLDRLEILQEKNQAAQSDNNMRNALGPQEFARQKNEVKRKISEKIMLVIKQLRNQLKISQNTIDNLYKQIQNLNQRTEQNIEPEQYVHKIEELLKERVRLDNKKKSLKFNNQAIRIISFKKIPESYPTSEQKFIAFISCVILYFFSLILLFFSKYALTKNEEEEEQQVSGVQKDLQGKKASIKENTNPISSVADNKTKCNANFKGEEKADSEAGNEIDMKSIKFSELLKRTNEKPMKRIAFFGCKAEHAAAHLLIHYKKQNKKILLIDFSGKEIIPYIGSRPGIIDLLLKKTRLDEIIYKDKITGIDIIIPGESTGSFNEWHFRYFKRTIEHLETLYDTILFSINGDPFIPLRYFLEEETDKIITTSSDNLKETKLWLMTLKLATFKNIFLLQTDHKPQ